MGIIFINVCLAIFYIGKRFVFTFVGESILHLWESRFYICGRVVFTFVGESFLHLWESRFYICGRVVFTFVGESFLHLWECFTFVGVLAFVGLSASLFHNHSAMVDYYDCLVIYWSLVYI